MPEVNNMAEQCELAAQVQILDNVYNTSPGITAAEVFKEEEDSNMFVVYVKMAKPTNPYDLEFDLPDYWTTSSFVDEMVPNEPVSEFTFTTYWYRLFADEGIEYNEATDAVQIGFE